MAEWRQDILGEGFECTDLDLGEDEEGPLVATLVRSFPRSPDEDEQPRPSKWQSFLDRMFHGKRESADEAIDAVGSTSLSGVDVMYVHGWSDYFFQRSVARFWTDRGANFYALDLRKYGRSLREGQTPGYIDNLDDYDTEIDLALAEMGQAESDRGVTDRKLVLFGHSTGGLVLSLWAGRHPGRTDAVVLNSPWLEFQLSAAGRALIAPIVALGARLRPREVAPQLDYGFYTLAQQEVGPKEEIHDINDTWRPPRSHAVHTGWLRAVLDGHARVQRGLNISAPVLVMLSQRSAIPLRWGEDLVHADTVLDVPAVAEAALHLGSTVTVSRIDGGLHDLFLSAPEPRAAAFAALEHWVVGWRASCALDADGTVPPPG